MKMTKIENISNGSDKNLPEPDRARLLQTCNETQQISDNANKILVTQLSGELSFTYKTSAPLPLMTSFEEAQSICFIIMYQHLPTLKGLEIVERNGKYYLGNMGFLRHILNEYRSSLLSNCLIRKTL
jgi:hypothetical protein